MFEKPKDFDPYGELSLNLFVGSVWKQYVEGKGPYTDDIWNCRGVDPVDGLKFHRAVLEYENVFSQIGFGYG